jgi:hypothetical protein
MKEQRSTLGEQMVAEIKSGNVLTVLEKYDPHADWPQYMRRALPAVDFDA